MRGTSTACAGRVRPVFTMTNVQTLMTNAESWGRLTQLDVGAWPLDFAIAPVR